MPTPRRRRRSASSPRSRSRSSRPTAKRGPIYFYISAWPKEGVKTEPSIKVGYPIAADKEMTVTVGADTFKLFAKGERGFVSEAAEETKLLDAMKSGPTPS